MALRGVSLQLSGTITLTSNVLEQRNGANAQTFRVYNTYTDASNYERLTLDFSSNVARLLVENLGTGSPRSLRVGTVGVGTINFIQANNTRWVIDANGYMQAGIDNLYDIGASGATRPRNLYMASWIRMATTVVASLPAAATAGAGARMFVTDALAPVFGSAVAGGGAVTVPVYSTGAAWNVG
jgi:hypothetical protein